MLTQLWQCVARKLMHIGIPWWEYEMRMWFTNYMRIEQRGQYYAPHTPTYMLDNTTRHHLRLSPTTALDTVARGGCVLHIGLELTAAHPQNLSRQMHGFADIWPEIAHMN